MPIGEERSLRRHSFVCCLVLQVLHATIFIFSSSRSAVEVIAQILEESTKSRTKSIELRVVDYAQELSDQLLKHSQFLEDLYKNLSIAVEKIDERNMKRLMDLYDSKKEWYVKAQARVDENQKLMMCFNFSPLELFTFW